MPVRKKHQTSLVLEPRAAVVAVGDELLLDRMDTNGQAMAQHLREIGWETRLRCLVPDQQAELAKLLAILVQDYPLIVCCGGLGPTQDDITRQAIAQVFGLPLRLHAPAYAAMEERFSQRNLPMPASNRIQAMLPQTARVLFNHRGTAAGFWLTTRSGILAALPGPPDECLPMLKEELLPVLQTRLATRAQPWQRVQLRAAMVAESRLQEQLGPLFAKPSPIELGFLLDEPGEILILLTLRNHPVQQAKGLLQAAKQRVQKVLGLDLVSASAKPMAEKVGELLWQRRETVAVAESCTGGLIARRLTSVPGSSRYFLEGFVTYSNLAKTRELKVSEKALQDHGAVSEIVARQMVLGLKKKSRADWCLATTGIAGPGGGSKAKPVGLVYIGLAGPGQMVQVYPMKFLGGRERIQRLSATAALNILRLQLSARAGSAKNLFS